MGHLEPSNDDLKALQESGDRSFQRAVGQIGIVNLSTKGNEVGFSGFHQPPCTSSSRRQTGLLSNLPSPLKQFIYSRCIFLHRSCIK